MAASCILARERVSLSITIRKGSSSHVYYTVHTCFISYMFGVALPIHPLSPMLL